MSKRRLTTDQVWAAVIAERLALVADLHELSAEQWRRPTACGDWDVHDVLAHQVDVAKTTVFALAKDLLAARFNFDRANQRGVRRERRADPAQTLTTLIEVSDRRTGPPAPVASRLVEAFVHGEDIRRAVGLAADYPRDAVLDAIGYQLVASTRIGGGKQYAAGLQLIASDVDFAVGEGPQVCGPAIALLLALTRRPVGADELSGEGAGVFRARTAAAVSS